MTNSNFLLGPDTVNERKRSVREREEGGGEQQIAATVIGCNSWNVRTKLQFPETVYYTRNERNKIQRGKNKLNRIYPSSELQLHFT